MEILNKIKEHLDLVGKDVKNYHYKIIFDGKFWYYQVHGDPLNGEEDYIEGDAETLREIYSMIKEEF